MLCKDVIRIIASIYLRNGGTHKIVLISKEWYSALNRDFISARFVEYYEELYKEKLNTNEVPKLTVFQLIKAFKSLKTMVFFFKLLRLKKSMILKNLFIKGSYVEIYQALMGCNGMITKKDIRLVMESLPCIEKCNFDICDCNQERINKYKIDFIDKYGNYDNLTTLIVLESLHTTQCDIVETILRLSFHRNYLN